MLLHNKRSFLLTLYINRIAIGVWCVCIFIVPLIVKWYDIYSNKESIFVPLAVILYLAMIPAFVILLLLNKLLTNIRSGAVFEHDNVKYLRIISYCCFVISAVFAVLMYWRLLAFLPVVAFAFVGLLLRVLKNVFEQAVIIREENDLTV